jgi:hypothetical protein
VKQLEFKDEIRFTDNEEYFVETRCFACDVMLYCGLGCDYASIYNLPIPDENSGYGLTRCQADSLLTILGEDEIPVYDFRDLEIISALERIAK